MEIIFFGGAFAVSLAINAFFVHLQSRGKISLKPLRFGGIGIIVAFFSCTMLSATIVKTPEIVGLLVGLFFILIVGLLDDLKNFSWKKQLFFQLFLAGIILCFGFAIQYISGPFEGMIRVDFLFFQVGNFSINVLGSLLVVFWLIAIINAVNWADGVDGFSGVIALLGSFALIVVSLAQHVNQPAIAILATIFSGSVCGFLWFNFPPAKIEAGSSGSYAIGFILAVLAIIAGTKIATAMIVLAVPIVDSFWVISERFFEKSPITKRDKRHLHYKLRFIGWSDTKIVLVYTAFIACVLMLSFAFSERAAKLSVIGVEFFVILFFIFKVSIKTKQLKKQHET